MKPVNITTSADTRIRVRIYDDSIEMRSQEQLKHKARLVWVDYPDIKVGVKLSEWAAFKEAVEKIDRLLMLK